LLKIAIKEFYQFQLELRSYSKEEVYLFMRDIHLVPVSYFPSENLEFPMVADQQTITPNELFYVRNHFEYPQIDINAWNLTIEGFVDRPIKFTYADLKSMKMVTLAATLECAGNKRGYL
jgi:DMSO/TMAO reductase YedYZ molybdopterin-dependent catalytic subunit